MEEISCTFILFHLGIVAKNVGILNFDPGTIKVKYESLVVHLLINNKNKLWTHGLYLGSLFFDSKTS